MMVERVSTSFPIWHAFPAEAPTRTAQFLCLNNRHLEVLQFSVTGPGKGLFASIKRGKKSTTYTYEGVNVSFWTDLVPIIQPLKIDFSFNSLNWV